MEIGLIYRWGRPLPGREEEGAKTFNEVLQYMTELKKKGDITYFEPFMFTTGDIEVDNGFFLVKGPEEALRRTMAEEKYLELLMRSQRNVAHFKVDFLLLQDRIPKLMEMSVKLAKQPALVH